jgi:DNA polymerase-3 subunit delta'
MKLYLASGDAERIETLAQELPHACLIAGPRGIGLLTIALKIAGPSLSGIIEPTDSKGEVDSTSAGVIRVTQIRDLSSSANNKSTTDRVYIIDNAENMNVQAQNAFLKLLEEPASRVHFILLSHRPELLLPTIISRVQTVRLSPINHQQSLDLLHALKVHDETMRSQLLFIADGLPAELTRLAHDPAELTRASDIIKDARTLLQGSVIERLQVINTYSSERPRTLELLSYVERILLHTLAQKPSADVIARADDVSIAYDRIAANGYIRIQLIRLVL